MSEIILYNPTTFTVYFEFDADLKESRRGAVKWSDKPAEAGFDITDMGHRPPEQFRLEGIISAWPMQSAANPLRVSTADAELRRLRDAMQPVGLITKWWAVEAVLVNAEASQSQGEGEALRFSLEAQTIRVAGVQYTQVPASKLKSTVKKRATPKPAKGGAASGKNVGTPTQEKDWIYRGRDALRKIFG